MLESITLLRVEIFLSVVALVLLMGDVLITKGLKWISFGVSLASLMAAFFMVVCHPIYGRAFGMMIVDPFSTFFKALAILSCFLIFLISEKDPELMGEHAGSYSALLLLSTVGTLFLACAEDLLIFFVGLELTTIPLFILAGFLRKELRSSEGAIKFFLVGAFSTGIMLFGISYLYGLCGSTHFSIIRNWLVLTPNAGNHILFLLGILCLLVGLGFKFSLVPFHQWTPDVYEGAPTPITAFFSVSREAGVLVVMLRFFSEYVNQGSLGLTSFFMLLSILTMTIGNLTALQQNNLKRLLAYSSIAHAGTIFIGVVAGNSLGREGAMVYGLAYFLMSLGAFAVVIAISKLRHSEEMEVLQGLARENLPMALLMAFFLLSLAGIPPFLGFWGKFYVFAAAMEAKQYGLVAIALLNTVIAVYYYFRILHKMFFQGPGKWAHVSVAERLNQKSLELATLFSAAALLFLGLFPQKLLAWIQTKAYLLP
jgi:NADH-quinone oxidoreductase subunit N